MLRAELAREHADEDVRLVLLGRGYDYVGSVDAGLALDVQRRAVALQAHDVVSVGELGGDLLADVDGDDVVALVGEDARELAAYFSAADDDNSHILPAFP